MLEFIGAMYGLDRKRVNRKADEFALVVRDEGEPGRENGEFLGMKQKVHIISGLHNPEVIFMDEPLNGLDVTR